MAHFNIWRENNFVRLVFINNLLMTLLNGRGRSNSAATALLFRPRRNSYLYWLEVILWAKMYIITRIDRNWTNLFRCTTTFCFAVSFLLHYSRILRNDKVQERWRRNLYYEKPFQTRQRLSYEKVKRVYDADMKRKIEFLMRKNRIEPWIR